MRHDIHIRAGGDTPCDCRPALPEHGVEATRLVELGTRARHGDAGALDALLREVQAPLRRYLLQRLRSAPDHADLACDLGQEVLIRAAAGLHRCTFPDDRHMLAWVRMIARNVLIDFVRTEQCRTAPVAGDRLQRLSDQASLAAWEAGRTAPARTPVLHALAAQAARELPGETRELLRLRVQLACTWKEAGAALNISEAAAKRRFQRVQATLRTRLLARLDALPPGQRDRMLRRLGQDAPSKQ